MARIKKAIFKFKPFSLKQKKILTWWFPESPVHECDGIIADGAIRSGKTISMSLSFVMWAMESFDLQNFGMCGKTIGSFRRNVLFWLKLMLRSRGYKVQDKRADNLVIVSRNDTVNYFYIFGGKDERSQDLIQGITLAGVFFDEVALMPESFVNQATGRCSVDGSKYWFNCNPAGPFHWFKINWIDKAVELNILYLHFTMDDNLSLSEKVKERYRRMYTGVFFKRYILGLWVAAEGLIYDMFDMLAHVAETVDRKYTEYFMAMDYGTQNPTAIGLFGFYQGKWYIVKEYYYSGRGEQKQKTDEEYYKDLVKFANGIPVKSIYIDPSAASFIACVRRHGKFIPYKANNAVIDGIRFTASLIQSGKLLINDCCKDLIKEIQGYCWDDDPEEDKPVKENDHCMDYMRYGAYTHIKRNAYKYGLHMVGREKR